MKELDIKNKLGLRVFVNGTPSLDQMSKQDRESFIISLTNCLETNIGKNSQNNIVKPVDINDTT